MTKTLNNGQKKSKRKKCLIWNRVSTSEQEHSLNAQVDACEEFANNLGFEKVYFHPPVSESAKSAGPIFKAMIKKLKDPRQGFDGIVVEYLDRFSRNVPEATKLIRELEENGIYFYTLVENINTENTEDLYRADGLFIAAEYENYKRSIKTKRAMKYWLEEGYWTATPPKGYVRNSTLPKEVRESREVYQDEFAPFIKLGFDRFLNGYRIIDIAKECTEMGFNSTDKAWSEYLRNPFYAGYLKHKCLGDKMVKGKHKPIISKSTFDKVQKKLTPKETQKNVDYGEHVFLTGVLTCSSCNRKMTPSPKTKGEKTYYYYKCPSKGCKQHYNATYPNKIFKEELKKYTLNTDYLDLIEQVTKEVVNENFQFESKKIPKLKEEKTKLEKRSTVILEEYYDGNILESEKNFMINKAHTRLSEIKEELDSSTHLNIDSLAKEIINDLNTLPDLWCNFDTSKINYLQQSFLKDDVVYLKESNQLRIGEVIPLFGL